jgi:hypothetical protein
VHLTALVLLISGLAPAAADTTPMILPDRDVAVAYQVSSPGRADQSYQFEYDAAGQRGRINNPAQGTYFLVDLPARTAQMIVPQLNSVVNAPDLANLTRQITDSGHDARFTLLGTAHYAGMSCQNWLVLSSQGSATACLTEDGVALHFAGKNAQGSGEVTATSVSFGTQPSGDFSPPNGFNAITLPPGVLQQLMNGGQAP